MTATTAYDNVANFIAHMDPEKVLELQADEEMQERLDFLIDREKNAVLSPEEKEELDQYILLERLIRLTKAKARYLLSK
jgi:hypothetical protein